LLLRFWEQNGCFASLESVTVKARALPSSVHTPAYKRFLARLRAARTAAGLSQRAVAKALGKAPSYVAKCETGERRVDVVELTQFADLYGKPLGYFVGRD